MVEDKVRENRLRRIAGRYGLRLIKSRRRDPHAIDYGLYNLVDIETSGCIFSHGVISEFNSTLDEVEDYLTDGK